MNSTPDSAERDIFPGAHGVSENVPENTKCPPGAGSPHWLKAKLTIEYNRLSDILPHYVPVQRIGAYTNECKNARMDTEAAGWAVAPENGR